MGLKTLQANFRAVETWSSTIREAAVSTQHEPETFLFLSQMLATPVVDAQGRKLGRITDFAALLIDPYPIVTRLILKPNGRGEPVTIPWTHIKATDQAYIVTDDAPRADFLKTRLDGEHLLKESLLDKQIVDTDGAKVRRVNDLHFLRAFNTLYLVHVDVGFRGLMRRVGLERALIATLRGLFDYELQDNLITWKYVQPVSSPDLIRLNIGQNRFSQLLPADLADILEDLDAKQRAAVFQSLDIETAAETLEETDPKIQVSLINELDAANASDIIEEMSLSEAADLLGELSPAKAAGILEEMEREIADDVKELLAHPEGVAGGLMTNSFITLTAEMSVSEAMQHIRREAEDIEFLYYLYVVDERERLKGMVSLRTLLCSEQTVTVAEIMESRIVTVNLSDEQDDIAEEFKKYGLMALPVVDDEDRILGVILLTSILELISHETRR